VTEPATIGPHDAPLHAGQVVRRVLLRRNIVIDDLKRQPEAFNPVLKEVDFTALGPAA
jgi:hypothetical protein